MNNFERGDKALQALTAVGYRNPSETEGITLPMPSGKEVLGSEGYPIADLIADLLHLAQRNGFDVAALLSEGMEHYGADCIEQAWEHSDNWDNTLQSKENIPRAESVLRSAGVPDVFDQAIFAKVGLMHVSDLNNNDNKED